ncbi:MAG TPA: bifunctional acetaldehyde-CoA/alcohol dehydrogenase, partial [Thermoanaerobacter sp.]|nr:bifunctional acetaldehyde-CoA/alcohol dehydrogenase [Thermoanaerobacter sp.]
MPTLLQEKKETKEKTEVKETTDVKKQIDLLVERAKRAQEKFMSYTQEQINEIVKAMALAGIEKHVELAKLAHEETKMGVYEDKITKNLFAVEYVYNYIKDKKTVGILKENLEENYMEVAEPV